MWPRAAQYNLVGRGLEIHGRYGILKIVYFLKNYMKTMLLYPR